MGSFIFMPVMCHCDCNAGMKGVFIFIIQEGNGKLFNLGILRNSYISHFL